MKILNPVWKTIGWRKKINQNILISFEFMTNETNCAIYNFADNRYDDNMNWSDKHILIKDGHLATQIYQDELTIHDSEGPDLSDG